MGKLSRAKGAAWEREVAEKIRSTVGVEAVRNLEECRDGNAGDVKCPALPIAWQCKVGARPDIYGAVEEASAVADPKHHFAVAVVKRNGTRHRPADELAVLPLAHFLDLLNLLMANRIW